MMSGDQACTRVTDAEYNKPKTRWVAHTRLQVFIPQNDDKIFGKYEY